jgi:Zn-dependent protease with chaperone function
VSESVIRVERWPSERPLAVLVWITALSIWLLLAVSLIGIAYALLLGLFFFVSHVLFIAYVRGNAVHLGPDQMPALHARVQALAQRIGMKRTPEAYVLQSGGVLNALATKFLGSNFIILYSDLIEACGENEHARDFIVAHELGHLHAGHLRWSWLLLPGLAMPFVGHAYSRAREYTCDRYGMAASTDADRALDGLCILAAGREQGPRVNRRALVEQRRDLETAWMKFGSWLFTHPSLAHRLAVLAPGLGEARVGRPLAVAGALSLLVLLLGVPTLAFVGLAGAFAKFGSVLQQAQQGQQAARAAPDPQEEVQVAEGPRSLWQAADHHRTLTGAAPGDADALYAHWARLHPGESEPLDPFDGERFGYAVEEERYLLWSAGPDPESDHDDVVWSGESGAPAP